jgi:hypothetical protein
LLQVFQLLNLHIYPRSIKLPGEKRSLNSSVRKSEIVYYIINIKKEIRNNIIKQKVNVKRSLLDDIKTKQLQRYGHVQRIDEGRLPKEVMKWRPPGRRKRGRPKLTWAEGIRGLMGEKRLMEEDWNDGSNWRKKII